MVSLDSITTTQTQPINSGEILMQTSNTGGAMRHPYQVLRTLPKDATPAQQDSAIQAAIQPQQIRYSSQPDTLRLPGQPLGKSAKEVNVPQYYNETYFKSDTLLHPEVNGGRMGIAGDPIAYQASNDNVVTSGLLLLLVMTITIVPKMKRFISLQFKGFIYPSHSDAINMKETAGEIEYQLLLDLQTIILLGFSFYCYAMDELADVYVVSNYELLSIFILIIMGVVLCREAITAWVNWTFFPRSMQVASRQSRLFITALEGVLLMPVVLVYTFFGMSSELMGLLTFSVIVLAKILTIYKVFIIFFKEKTRFLQFFLYFCTLEVIPLTIMWGTLLLVGNLLKITY